MITRSIQQEELNFVNISAPSIRTPKHIKQVLIDIEGVMTDIVGDPNNPLTSMYRSPRQTEQGNRGLK